jgi:hypothetical protein
MVIQVWCSRGEERQERRKLDWMPENEEDEEGDSDEGRV